MCVSSERTSAKQKKYFVFSCAGECFHWRNGRTQDLIWFPDADLTAAMISRSRGTQETEITVLENIHLNVALVWFVYLLIYSLWIMTLVINNLVFYQVPKDGRICCHTAVARGESRQCCIIMIVMRTELVDKKKCVDRRRTLGMKVEQMLFSSSADDP